MLIYLQPAFYCNVSDAWLFPEKSKRLWVTFAGAYFEPGKGDRGCAGRSQNCGQGSGPQRQFESRIIAVAPTASNAKQPVLGRTVLVTTRLNNLEGLLKPEMTGHAKIYCGQHRLIYLPVALFDIPR